MYGWQEINIHNNNEPWQINREVIYKKANGAQEGATSHTMEERERERERNSLAFLNSRK